MKTTFLNDFYIVKNNLIKQTRSFKFLIIIAIGMFLGSICVPIATSNYTVIGIANMRGIYNSAWLGAVGSILSMVLVWLPGFYLLRSEISEDNNLKIGQIIASTPISKFRYISIKAISNLIILIVLQICFVLALIVMQLIRGESDIIILSRYIFPFLIISIPNLCILSAFTILFDVIPFLKKTIGNVIFFIVWTFVLFAGTSETIPYLDLFGMNYFMPSMIESASAKYNIVGDFGTNVGYNPTTETIKTFEWLGVDKWDTNYIASKIIYICIAIIVVSFASIIFDRFKKSNKLKNKSRFKNLYNEKEEIYITKSNYDYYLSPVKKEKSINILRLVKGELKIMCARQSIWLYLCVLTAMVFSLFFSNIFVIGSIVLLPMAIYSSLGCRDKEYATQSFILSSCSPLYKWWASWISGVFVSLFVSSFMIVRLIYLGQYEILLAWIIGAIFVPTLALFLGNISGKRRLFEVIYILMFYIGPLNKVVFFDFTINTGLYFMLTCVLLALGTFFAKTNYKS